MEFLEPFSTTHQPLKSPVLGLLTLSGTIEVRAFLNVNEYVSGALQVLKQDIIQSMQSRVDLLIEELTNQGW